MVWNSFKLHVVSIILCTKDQKPTLNGCNGWVQMWHNKADQNNDSPVESTTFQRDRGKEMTKKIDILFKDHGQRSSCYHLQYGVEKVPGHWMIIHLKEPQ